MRKDITKCTCDRCGYSLEVDLESEELSFMTAIEKKIFCDKGQFHEVNGYDLCDKCYNNYITVFKNFMEVGKE